jgi:hypothetical protein
LRNETEDKMTNYLRDEGNVLERYCNLEVNPQTRFQHIPRQIYVIFKSSFNNLWYEKLLCGKDSPLLIKNVYFFEDNL